MIENRILYTAEVKPDTLLANPRNYRDHPEHQIKTMGSVLDNLGWVQRVIVNIKTGHIIDGHMRVNMAKAKGELVPVAYVDLTQAEEEIILATMDPLAAMAVTDYDMAAELASLVKTDSEELLALITVDGPDRGEITAPPDDVNLREDYDLIVECYSPHQQEATLKELTKMGYTCKAEMI